MKDASTTYNWLDRHRVDSNWIDCFFELFLGRQPSSDAERKVLLDLARQSSMPRIQTFDHLVRKADFFGKNRELLPMFLDLMVRARVFGGHVPPKTNLFCVGVARCGTTTLSTLLNSHSDVHIPLLKETNFFSHFSKNVVDSGFGNEIYGSYFIGWAGQSHVGDFSPNYLSDKRAIDGVFNYNPDAKILICVRNPIERAVSAFFYTKDAHHQEDIFQFYLDGVTEIKKDNGNKGSWCSPQALLRQGLSSSDISYVKSRFKDVLLVEFSEFRNIENLYQRLCEFIGITPEAIPDILKSPIRINASTKSVDPRIEKAKELLHEFYAGEVASFRRDHTINLL